MATPLAAIGAGAQRRVRRLPPRRPLHVLRGLRAQGGAAQAAGRDPRPRRRPPRLRHRADRRLLPRPTGSSCSRTAPTPTAPTGTARVPASFGDAGVYSLYATKTVSSGEGGVLVSGNEDLLEYAAQVPQLRQVRSPGRRPQLPDERVHRRRSRWSRPSGWRRSSPGRTSTRASISTRVHPARLAAPRGDDAPASTSTSSSRQIEKSTGKVYDQPCHRIMGRSDELPNTDWVAENHWCVPLYYRPESRDAAVCRQGGLSDEGPGDRRRGLHRLPRRRQADRDGA